MQPSIPWSSSLSVFVIERTAIIHSLKCTVPFSLPVPLLSLAVTHCHLLSLVVLLAVTFWYLLYHSLSLVVIRCHSLSFIVTRCTTRCTSCHSLSLVVTRCTTRLSFYKRSIICTKKWEMKSHLAVQISRVSYVKNYVNSQEIVLGGPLCLKGGDNFTEFSE